MKVLPPSTWLVTPDRAAVHLDQLPDQRQADAGALVACATSTPGTRWNRSKTCGSSSGTMPTPVSVTSSRAAPSTARIRTRDLARRR